MVRVISDFPFTDNKAPRGNAGKARRHPVEQVNPGHLFPALVEPHAQAAAHELMRRRIGRRAAFISVEPRQKLLRDTQAIKLAKNLVVRIGRRHCAGIVTHAKQLPVEMPFPGIGRVPHKQLMHRMPGIPAQSPIDKQILTHAPANPMPPCTY
jgi:hypothetical protein